MAELLKQVFETADGRKFDTKQEALDYLRKPKILEALNAVTNSNAELNEWLFDHQDLLEDIFSSGTIQRVTKAERKKLEEALEAVKAVEDKKLAFIKENAAAILESFRWPTTKRMDAEEKEQLITNSLMATTENNKELVDWIKASKEGIFTAFEAGKIKREVSPKATEALAAYRAKKAAEKEAAEAANGSAA